MTLQFISLFFVTDKTQLGQTEVLTRYLTNMCFPPTLPSISFPYTNQLGEIPVQKLTGQTECRCLHWPNPTAHSWICPEHYPACQWSPDTIGTLQTLPVFAQSGRGDHQDFSQRRTKYCLSSHGAPWHLSAWSGRKIVLRFFSDRISGTS